MSDDQDQEVVLSDKVRSRLEDLRYLGSFDQATAEARDCQLIESTHGADSAYDHIKLHWLVDDAGYIRDVRYRTLATGLDLVAVDLMAELCVGITAEQAATISPAHVIERLQLVYDQQVEELAWNKTVPFVVLMKAANTVDATLGSGADDAAGGSATAPKEARFPDDWLEIGLFEKVRRIEEVLDSDIRPMLASDGGGIDLIDLREDELVVEYNGACGSCSASLGGTMHFIEDTLSNELGVTLRLNVQGMEPEPFIDL